MEAAGFVTRTREKDDRRSVWVTITPAGDAVRTEWRATVNALIEEAFKPLSTSDMRSMTEILSRIAPPIHGPPPGLLRQVRQDAPDTQKRPAKKKRAASRRGRR